MNQQRAQKILDRLDVLAAISDRKDEICRTFGTEASTQVRELVGQWMKDVGLETRVDSLLNIRGVYRGEAAKTFLMGSHLDTVINAGKFDGILGVLMALDQAERLHETAAKLPFSFEVVGFSEEEGVRFRKPYLGSCALAGTFDTQWLELTDAQNISLGEVLSSHNQNLKDIPQEALIDQEVHGFLEVHIEQGPILDHLELPVGLVTGIAGQHRHQISLIGEAGHAGTVPLTSRKDALIGASELIIAVEQIALEYSQMVATVGKIELLPNVANVIPEKVNISLDVRHQDELELNDAVDRMRQKTQEIAEKRQLVSFWEQIMAVSPVTCDKNLTEQLEQAILKAGYHAKRLMSGAGHDAVAMATIAPVTMLFVRSEEGISHNPLESTAVEDIQAAISVCDLFFDNLANNV